jgi:hypothetical protein
VFDYDWFHGNQFAEQQEESQWRCSLRRFPELDRDDAFENDSFREFWESLKIRTLVYLRDGFSYELKELTDLPSKSHLNFECEPVDDQYKVGSFVVSVPFDDVARVEIFAVHPSEMPADMPAITGFRARGEPQPAPPAPS